MTSRLLAVGAALWIATGALGCGGGGAKGGKDGVAGDASGHAGDAAGASGAAGGTAGATDGGPSDATDAPVDVPSSADAGDAPVDAPSEGLDGADAMVEMAPLYDAGSDCLPPTEGTLTPTGGIVADGLVLWLRADHGVYKTATNAVCAWADQSGHGTIFTNVRTRPTWAGTGLGGQAAIHYTDAGQVMATAGVLGLPPTSARTIVAVSTLVATTQRFEPFFQGQSGSPGTYLGLDANTFQTAGSREGVYVMNNGYDATLATAASPRIHVYTLSTMTPGTPVLSGIDYRINGATQTLTRTPGGLGNGNFEDYSAANVTVVGGGAEAFISEVIVYARALTVDERVAIEATLKQRYGIP